MSHVKIDPESDSADSETKSDCKCSAYNKLTRKCFCLNQPEYNDFVMLFNENNKYRTNDAGEVIKNIRILKKFMYMSCIYTKNALMFLIEGLSRSSDKEKVEIIEGCSHADICNLFEEHSIVSFCITWPWKFLDYGDCFIQVQAANLLHMLAQEEQGKKYLNLNSKITSDIKRITKKRTSHLEPKTLELLKSTKQLLNPLAIASNVYFECRTPSAESMTSQESKPFSRIQMINKAQNTFVVKRIKINPTFTN